MKYVYHHREGWKASVGSVSSNTTYETVQTQACLELREERVSVFHLYAEQWRFCLLGYISHHTSTLVSGAML